MSKEINGHPIGRYRDGPRLIEFCKVCGREEMELYRAPCKKVELPTEEKKEKFVSGLPDEEGQN